MGERTIKAGNDEFGIEVQPDGEVVLRGVQWPNAIGRSRPRFETRQCADGTWCVHLADQDNAWGADTLADAFHLRAVLQAVVDRHLAAAREEGRRAGLIEARGICQRRLLSGAVGEISTLLHDREG